MSPGECEHVYHPSSGRCLRCGAPDGAPLFHPDPEPEAPGKPLANPGRISHVGGAARHEDPGTSKEAAAKLDASGLLQLVLEHLQACGERGATSEEVANAVGVDLQSISPRFAQLQRAGKIWKDGTKRPGSSGRKRQVWRAAQGA